jgi:hypothetical protein
MADILFLDPERSETEDAAWLDHIERGLCELVAAIRLLRDPRARGSRSGLASGLPPDVLKTVLRNLASDLHDLQAAIREFERSLDHRDPDGRPTR